MDGVTLHQLQCFDAVVSQGGFQAGAAKLGRTHSTVFTSIKNLENQLGLRLFNRDGYRVSLTGEGRAFHQRASAFLQDAALLRDHARHLALGQESELRIVIGDMCPLPEVLGLLRRFFDDCPTTRFHLHSEAISGPWETSWAFRCRGRSRPSRCAATCNAWCATRRDIRGAATTI